MEAKAARVEAELVERDKVPLICGRNVVIRCYGGSGANVLVVC